MAEETKLIRDQIAETRGHLDENFAELGDQVKQRIRSATDKVAETIEKVKVGVEKLTPRYQIENHPLRTLGGVIAAGVVTGHIFGRRRGRQPLPATHRGSSLMDLLAAEFATVKRAAVGAIISAAGNALRDAIPKERKLRVL